MSVLLEQDRVTPESVMHELGESLARVCCVVWHRDHPTGTLGRACAVCRKQGAKWAAPVAKELLRIGSSGNREMTEDDAARVGRMLEMLEWAGRGESAEEIT